MHTHELQQGGNIRKNHKRWLVAASIVVAIAVGVVLAVNRTAIAQQAKVLGLLPQPERFSAIYFTDYQTLASILPGKPHPIPFSIVNNEYRTTQYHYQISAQSIDGAKTVELGTGDTHLEHAAAAMLAPKITMPPLGPRVEIIVTVTYDGIVRGESTPKSQSQTLHYWLHNDTQRAQGGR